MTWTKLGAKSAMRALRVFENQRIMDEDSEDLPPTATKKCHPIVTRV